MSIIYTLIILGFLVFFMIYRKKKYPLDAFNMTIFFFIIVYVLIPEFLPLSYGCYPFCDGVPWLPRMIALIGLGTFIFGFYLSKVFPVFKLDKGVSFSENYQYKMVLFMTFLSLIFLYIYAQSFGGFLEAFSYGSIMRYSGENILDVKSSLAIVTYFIPIVYIIFGIVQYKLYLGTYYKKRYIFIILIISCIILSQSIISGSRGAVFQVFLILIFIYLNLDGIKIKLKKIIFFILVFMIGLFLVTNGKSTISSISTLFQGKSFKEVLSNNESKNFEYIYGRLIVEFSHPIKSLGIVIDSEIEFNGMKHFLYAPLDLIPTKLLGIYTEKPIRIHEINSELVSGDPNIGIPPGIIASLWYGGGIFSILFGMLISGIFIGWVQKQSYKIISVYPIFTPIVLYMFLKMSMFITNGDLSVFLKHEIHILLFFVLLMVFLFLYSLYKLFFRDYIKQKHKYLGSY